MSKFQCEFQYLENEKSFLDKKKSIFHLIIHRISFGEKKKNSGDKL